MFIDSVVLGEEEFTMYFSVIKALRGPVVKEPNLL